MNEVALITGASGGIGEELARIHAKKGGDLVLVARTRARLHALQAELESEYKITVTVIVEDLSLAGSAQKVFSATQAGGMKVGILINNAGFGGYGNFCEGDLSGYESMMQLNMNTLTSLTHLYLQDMVKQRRGRILNVASTAGFVPGPLHAVYYATKAYVISFSQAIAEELTGTGVTVTALCPGPVETEFVARANLEGVRVFKNAASAASVAEYGYKAMAQGKLVAINDGTLGFVVNWLIPFMPRRLLLKLSRRVMQKAR